MTQQDSTRSDDAPDKLPPLTPEEFKEMTAGVGEILPMPIDKEGVIIGLAKGLAQSSLSLEAASSLVVSVNMLNGQPLDQQKLTIDFKTGWQQYRADSLSAVGFSIINAVELVKKNMPLPDTVVEGLMYQGDLGMLAGWQGRGKSFFALGLALSIATEQPKFVGYNIKKFGNVIYIDYEQSPRQTHKRLKDHPLTHLLEKSKYQLHFIHDAPEVTDKKFMDWLVRQVDIQKPILLIVDNVTMAHSGDENSSRDVIQLMKRMKSLVADFGINVLLLHHFRKGVRFEVLSLEHVSGSGAWSRLLNFALLMTNSAKDEALRIFKADKLRDWPEVYKKAFGARLVYPGGNFVYDSIIENEAEHLPQATMSAKGEVNWGQFMKSGVEMSRDQIITELKARGTMAAPSTIDNWLKKAVTEGVLLHPRDKYYIWQSMDTFKKEMEQMLKR